ncbi:unnamed protein product [Medioppia subpectinata]|uniref:DBF4-type domain-containing protein n=1 Tax=Medioppia subpectinata TaxID=1979941 RepID=A0A7R9KWD3_9ACAR|nr:unnamed protein product [Medioppia subpectinata]CAG2109930.1 unnamed protein product [Medioppia subpectinata]
MAGFEGKNFYFDLQNSPLIAKQLSQSITQLGGEIKEFLDQRVKYIITSRPKDQWPPKKTTPVIQDKSRHQLEALKEQTIQSPINLNKNSSFSRGSLLLSRIRANTVANESKPVVLPTDVLERGRLWNIQILNALDVLEFCKKHLSPRVVSECAVNSIQTRRLKGPHLKVEDNRLQHRPLYKEFYEWPTINFEFQELLCPFVKKKVQNRDKPVEPIESLEGLAVKRFEANNKTPNAKNADNKCLNENNNINNTNNKSHKSKTKSPKCVTKSPPKTPPKDVTLIKKNLIKRRRTPAYCEICGVEFDDLAEHLKSEDHESYSRNDDNYKELRGVIQSLQPFLETSSSAKCVNFDSDCSDDTDCDDNDDHPIQHSDGDLPCSPFQSTPNMSTTIQLCGSKHKSHFLPIHDLVGNHSPLELIEADEHPVVAEEELHDGHHCRRSSDTELEVIPASISSPKCPLKQTLNYDKCLSSDSTLNAISEEL